MKSVLILGAGVMQGPAIRLAREMGLYVVVADGNPEAEHARDADRFMHVDLKDKDGLLAAARDIPGLAGVFTAGTDFSASVAWVAERLGLPGIPYETALDASDKARMRTRLAAAGVPVPRFGYGTRDDDPSTIAASLRPGAPPSFPLVVKPVDNMGARGCRMARDAGELAAAWEAAVANSRRGTAIVEEYLDGPEFSLDAVVHRGRIVLRGAADRFIRFPPYFVEMGHTMPSAYGPEVLAKVIGVFERGIRALGISNGAAKGDIKYTREGAFVGEIAARLSGGYMSGWTYPYSSGIQPIAEALAVACGMEPVFDGLSLDLVSAERAFISIPGRVKAVYGLDEAGKAVHVRHVFTRMKEGATVTFPTNNVEKCGNVIAVAADRREAESAAERAARSILIRLEPGDPVTRESIMGPRRGTDWPPEAYEGLSAMIRAVAQAEPDLARLKTPARSVSIAPLPGFDREESVDWQGRTLRESVDAVTAMTGARLGRDGDVVVDGLFWKALFRGGYQAGAWVVDDALREHGTT